MVINGRTRDLLPGNKLHVRRRCNKTLCCKPDHLYLTAPDGYELSLEQAETWLRSGETRWQDAVDAGDLNDTGRSSGRAESLEPDGPLIERTATSVSSDVSEGDLQKNQRPTSWLDAFPWLMGAAEIGSPPWWDEPIDDFNTAPRLQRLAEISRLAMERLTQWTIGQIFPGLSPDVDFRELPLTVRAKNVLQREGCNTAADLAGVTLDSMMDWRQVGIGTVDVILRTLADFSTSITTPPVVTQHLSPSQPRSHPHGGATQPSWTSSVVDALSVIAEWFATVGTPGQALLSTELAVGAPPAVLKARQHLETLRADDVLGEDQLALDAAALFDAALRQLDSRAIQVLRHRLFADDPFTLDELGRQHNVTRERIRQIEGKARGEMLSSISGEGALATVAEAARTLIGTIRPLDELLSFMPALGRLVESVGHPAWRVLDRLDDAYEIEDGWCVVPTMTAARVMTQTQLQERADKYGVVRLEDLMLVETAEPDRRPEFTASWLSHCGYIIEGAFVLTRTQSIGDYAAAILSLTGTPMSSKDILDRFVFERSVTSLRNTMALDDRFERVDRDRWALTEWGMDTYAGIRSLIREMVTRNGGRVDLDNLVENITGRYSVSANSVIAYASSPPFEQRDGVVRLAGEGQEVRKTPGRTRRLFRQHDAWAYRIRVSKDHLRGSGSVAPKAIATILGLQFGETRQLESPLGPQVVAWTGTQPSFGTIRRFLLDGDIAAGTDAFLVLHDDGSFSFSPCRDMTGEPLTDVLSLIGTPGTTDREDARSALARAVGMDDTAPIVSVIAAYRERGDGDVADLLTSLRHFLETGEMDQQEPKHNAAVDEILDLL
ncbi:sigma factor-like helix-turn-helix DNA-binding protein [Mycolicibacterium celeriflavum]|nr:sigma factor-like helix-turn-helix DNA-binding protein [Mycolicibacterium celeriflavum]MCV7240426.1 hypothetical protein [Mycolicibacterium celeriflavum]